MLCLFLLGQSLHEFANSQDHLLHGDVTAIDGLIEQQTEAGDGENTKKSGLPPWEVRWLWFKISRKRVQNRQEPAIPEPCGIAP